MKYRIEEIHRKNGNIQFFPQYKRWLFWHYYNMLKTNGLTYHIWFLKKADAETFIAKEKEEKQMLQRKHEGEKIVSRRVYEWYS